jgi:afadin
MPQQQQQQQQQQAPPQQQQLPQPVPNISGRASAVPVFNEPELHVLKLQKSNNGMGLSIVAARGVNQDRLGIYIKSVVKGGAADQVSD